MRFVLAVMSLCLAQCAPASAAPQRVNPQTLAAVLKAAKPGDRIVLEPGRSYGDVVLPPADHRVPVEIVATDAKVRSLTVRNTSGWRWQGGTIDSPLPPKVQPFPRDAVWRNVMIDNAHRFEMANVTLTGGHTGVLVTRGSSDIVLRENIATGLEADGFNIATATRVKLIGNTCRDFRPVAPVYQGTRMVKDGTHPDCIMLWSEAGKAPTSDIDIIGNRAIGQMQGIAHFYHPQMGRDKVYRLRVEDNELELAGYWHAIMLENAPGSTVSRNIVRTAPGSTAPGRPDLKPRVWVKADADAVRCGNVVDGRRDRAC